MMMMGGEHCYELDTLLVRCRLQLRHLVGQDDIIVRAQLFAKENEAPAHIIRVHCSRLLSLAVDKQVHVIVTATRYRNDFHLACDGGGKGTR